MKHLTAALYEGEITLDEFAILVWLGIVGGLARDLVRARRGAPVAPLDEVPRADRRRAGRGRLRRVHRSSEVVCPLRSDPPGSRGSRLNPLRTKGLRGGRRPPRFQTHT